MIQLATTAEATQRAAFYQGCFLEGKNRFVNLKLIFRSKNPHGV